MIRPCLLCISFLFHICLLSYILAYLPISVSLICPFHGQINFHIVHFNGTKLFPFLFSILLGELLNEPFVGLMEVTDCKLYKQITKLVQFIMNKIQMEYIPIPGNLFIYPLMVLFVCKSRITSLVQKQS